MVYLLEIIATLDKKKFEEQRKVLEREVIKEIVPFLAQHSQEHQARVTLRKLVYQGKIEVPPKYKKMLIREERDLRVARVRNARQE